MYGYGRNASAGLSRYRVVERQAKNEKHSLQNRRGKSLWCGQRGALCVLVLMVAMGGRTSRGQEGLLREGRLE